MESFVEDKQKSEDQNTSQTNQNTIYVDNNNRRIHDEETKSILSQMNLATRSILWELEPVQIKYLFSVLHLTVNGKKVMTLRGIHRAMLKEKSKNNRRNKK